MTSTRRATTIRELVPLLFVENLEQSSAFYRDRLGFDMSLKWEPEGKLMWCRLQRDGSAVMLQQACDEDGPAAGRGRGVVFYFHCADADELHAEFTDGGLVLNPPETAFYGMRQFSVHDPDGYELWFQSPVG